MNKQNGVQEMEIGAGQELHEPEYDRINKFLYELAMLSYKHEIVIDPHGPSGKPIVRFMDSLEDSMEWYGQERVSYTRL